MTKEEFLRLYPTSFNREEKLDWAKVETQLGFNFPDEFCFIIENYGTISLGNFITVFNPFSENKSINLDAIKFYTDSYKYLKSQFPNSYKRPSESFLTWAVTDNGDTLFWDIHDQKNHNGWHVGIHDKSQSEEEVFPMTTLEFLHNVASGKLKNSIFPRDFFEGTKTFKSIPD